MGEGCCIFLITTCIMSLETIINFAGMVACPDECIYALVNDEDKRVQVYSTKSFLSHLIGIVKETKYGFNLMGEDTKKIRIVILETVLEGNTRVLVSKYRNQYKDLGYKPYKEYKDSKYRLVAEPVGRYDELKYGVYLRGYNVNDLLGEFDTYAEAKRYMDTYVW